jgi:hypothetical protein
MSQFIRSSARTKPDPAYYQRIYNRLEDQRAELFVVIEMEEGCTGIEAKALRHKADMLSQKIRWAGRMIVVASRMKDNLAAARSQS